MKSTVLIITGMHRSGTSLTASLFQSLGVNIGEKLVGPEYGNIKGHFEDIEFVELHKGILRSQQIDDLGSNIEIKEIPVKKQYLKAAKRLIKNRQEEKQRKNKFWGWKDPRTTLFLNFWSNLLPDAKFIFVYRSPWEVVDSLYRRGTDQKLLEQPEIAVKMWLNYNQRILDFYQKFSAQCLIGKVDSIGKNPESFIEAVNEKFEIDLAVPPTGNFTESLLVKDISKTTKPSLIEKYFPETLEVYQQLEKISIGGDEEVISQKSEVRIKESELNTQGSKFEGKSELLEFQDWLNIRGLEKKINSLETDVERWQEIFREAKQKVGNLETELGKTQQKLDIRSLKLQESSKKLELLEIELGKAQIQLEGKDTNLQASQTKIVTLERKLGQTQSQLENNQTKLQESQQKIIRLEIDLGQTQAQINNSKTRFQEALAKILSLETELGKTLVQLEGTQIKLTESQRKLLAVETDFGQTQIQLERNKIKLGESQEKIGILETELGQTQLQLNGNILKLQESQNKIQLLETELGEAQGLLDGTQVKLSESQNKIQLLETELGETQGVLDGTQVKLSESQNKIQLLETELGETQGVLGQTQVVLGQTQTTLEQTKVELNAQNYETETLRAEISAMKSSKFWKLREKWFSLKGKLKRRLRSLTSRFLFSIDSPINWKISSSQIEIVGWCFHNSLNIQNIRARVGTETFLGTYGIPRLDVTQQYNDISTAENSGFQISVQLSPGNYQLTMEAEDRKGKWHEFVTHPISVSTVEANFDAPTNWQQREGVILFAGWCCHPEQKITKLVLKCGDISVDCAYGLRRKDVGEVFPDWVGSEHSGFEVTVEVPSGKWEVSLEAYLETGEIVGFTCSEILKLKRYSFWEKTKDKFQELSKFAKAIQKRTAERKQRLGRILPLPSELPSIARQILAIYRQQQKQDGELLPPPGFVLPETIDVYDAWLAVNKWGDRSLQYLVSRLEGSQTPLPKISVVMPVYNPPVEFLRKGIASVLNQVYQNWEFCIADDCSTNLDIREILTEIAKTDSRIKLTFRSENGNISAATNSAAELATGDFILFLDNDDELTPDALGEVALYISQNPEIDFLYSDDDKINTEGKRFDPQFKPEYSPELLLSYMYMGHLCVVRKEIFDRIGGLRIGFEGSQDYDFALRATEISRQVGHLPLVLYHWRTSPGSTAISGGEKPKSFLAGQKAVQESLIRRGIAGNIYQPDWALREKLGIFKPSFPDQGDSVTIIIPTKNQAKLLKACIESLRKTTYQNYQVFVIDNESDEPESLEYLASLKDLYFGEANISVIPIANTDGKFNFAAINNRAVKQAKTEYILFLNNDTEIISPHWLSQMMGYAKIPGVGAVGAKLIYPDQRVQHAGVIHGLHHGLAGHAFKLLHSENRGYLSQAFVSRNYSAVTAACMLTSRKLFLELGGFDEENFAVAYNDADYGYQLLEKGYRSVYCPDAELIHKEGTSRGYSDNPQEEANYRRKYSRMIDGFYSPHFSLESELFEIQARKFFMKEEGRRKKEEGRKEEVSIKSDNSQKDLELNTQKLEANSPNESELNAQAKVDNSQKESELNAQVKVDNSQKDSELNTQAINCLFPVSSLGAHSLASVADAGSHRCSLFPPNPKIKLLMCSNSLDLTGAPLHQLEIALKLAKDGIVEPIIFSVNDGELREIYQQQNIQVIVKDNPLEHIYQRDAYDSALTTFAEEIKSLDIDVMYINTLENFFMVDVAQMLNIPSVWNVHESQPWQTYFNRFGNDIAARALECFRYPYRIIFVSDATRNKYLSLNSHHNFTVVHNGLDLDLLKKASAKWSRREARLALGIKKDEIVILLLGTVCERKGQHDLVKALSFMSEEERQKIKCFIVGDRPNLYSLKLHELVKSLPEEFQQKVEIVEETSETAKYYQAADIFVCTSRIESFPRVILEAMAYNLPIVTTPVFGIVEQVKQNINGLFYTPDNPEELANVLTSLLIDEELRQRLGGNAKYVLESLNTFAEMTETYGQIFQEAYFSLDKLADMEDGKAHTIMPRIH
ncbi:glycosyltransferase [Dapis sp. BLCC M126]|uniref:glycosyltransferase n=1 Tax=Dapis sp. BLCC M126 TaxID=3400189 RepID=UPI003CF5684F